MVSSLIPDEAVSEAVPVYINTALGPQSNKPVQHIYHFVFDNITTMTIATTNGNIKGLSNGHASDSTSAATKFRRMLSTNDIVVAPGVYDGFGARIAHEVGFEAIYMVGSLPAILL